jgi:hypothetical protein
LFEDGDIYPLGCVILVLSLKNEVPFYLSIL